MQLSIEKYIGLPQRTNKLPTRAVVFFDLTNQFNSRGSGPFVPSIFFILARRSFFSVSGGSLGSANTKKQTDAEQREAEFLTR
jgi:hypothetical protein